MAAKHNALDSTEMYELANLVAAVDKPFRDWGQAMRFFSAKMGRSITRSNIETAATACKAAIDGVVLQNERSSPLAFAIERVKRLESRVEALEKAVGSCS